MDQATAIQHYLNTQKEIAAVEKFADMWRVPDDNGNFATAMSVLNLRAEYIAAATSANVHTDEFFNKYAAAFIDANMLELAPRIALFAHEALDKEKEAAMAELQSANLFPVCAPYIPAQTFTTPASTAFTYQVKAAHTTNSNHAPTPAKFEFRGTVPTGIIIDENTGVISGSFDPGDIGTVGVEVAASNSGGTATGIVTFIIT